MPWSYFDWWKLRKSWKKLRLVPSGDKLTFFLVLVLAGWFVDPINLLLWGGSCGINLTNFRQTNLKLHNRTNKNMIHMYGVDMHFDMFAKSPHAYAIIWTCRDKNREVSVSLNLPIQIIQTGSPNFLHKSRVFLT